MEFKKTSQIFFFYLQYWKINDRENEKLNSGFGKREIFKHDR